jgi:hypothetical protein
MPHSGTSSSEQGNSLWDRDMARHALRAPLGHDAGRSPGCGWYSAVGGPDNPPAPYTSWARQEKDSPLIALHPPLDRPQHAATWGSSRNGYCC